MTRWPESAEELVAAQTELGAATPPPWRAPDRPLVIGACAFVSEDDRAWAAATVMRGRRVLASSVRSGTARAPYAPGLLALREGPLLEAAVRELETAPDVLLVDATGRDHPRRAGLALHLGAVLDLATVGVTSRPLLSGGEMPGPTRGATSPLTLDAETVAAWVRTRADTKPLAVHAAWRTDVETAVAVTLRAAAGHRTPEPLRQARRAARLARAAA